MKSLHVDNYEEYEFLFTDINNDVACLTTGGYGFIGIESSSLVQEMVRIRDNILQLPESCKCLIIDPDLKNCGRSAYVTWAEFSERGIYGYDYDRIYDKYQLRTCPESSLKWMLNERLPMLRCEFCAGNGIIGNDVIYSLLEYLKQYNGG